MLGVLPKDCLVVEDSKNGVTAAKAAGMVVLGYQNPTSGQQDLSQAEVTVTAFKAAKRLLFEEDWF